MAKNTNANNTTPAIAPEQKAPISPFEPTTPAPSAPPVAPEPTAINLTSAEIKELFDTVRSQTQTINSLQEDLLKANKDVEKLLAISDKKALSRYNEQQDIKRIPEYKVSFLGNKAVLAWKTVKDEVYKVNNIWHANQVVEVYLDDGTSSQMQLLDFGRLRKEKAYFKRQETDASGNITLVLEFAKEKSLGDYAGKEIKIALTFVN